MITEEDEYWWEYQCVVMRKKSSANFLDYSPSKAFASTLDIEVKNFHLPSVLASILDGVTGIKYVNSDQCKDELISHHYKNEYNIINIRYKIFESDDFVKFFNLFQSISMNLRSSPRTPVVLQSIVYLNI